MQNELLALARPEIVSMSAYVSARSEGNKGSIYLDANENPWCDGSYNRYPEPQPYSLVSSLATEYAVKLDQVLVTRGSDEGIDLLVRLFCRAGLDKILICPPTYGMYKVAATIQGAEIIEVPLLKNQGFTLDKKNILQACQSDVKLIFLCSPNNPTGNSLDVSDILSLCKELSTKSIIVVDEAYIEFSNSDSLVKHLNEYPNLVVLRTLSKAYGLAGIRCGVTLANSWIIQLLKKIIAPYPVSEAVVNIVLKKLNQKVMEDQTKVICYERNKLYEFLSSLTSVRKVWNSDTNFLLFEVDNSKNILNVCFKNGIVIRDRSKEYNLSNCLRVSIGSPEENTLLMEVLDRV